jgi:SAM-dependent methyltransferase
MRTDMDVYDQLLELQAEASFGLERRLFQFEEFEQARSVIDLGCGNASFAMRLASAFPHKHFLGVDPNGSLLARGRARAMPRNLELFEGDFDALPAGAVADVLVARLMMMYVKEPEALARSASGRIPTVIVVDIADDLFDVRPALRASPKRSRPPERWAISASAAIWRPTPPRSGGMPAMSWSPRRMSSYRAAAARP